MRLKGNLPRLAAEHYRGRAYVHWTLTIENRATGWLTREFFHAWQINLLHACARYHMMSPAYVLMPDHLHLLLLGLNDTESDQRVAVEFLRKHLRPNLAPADWQHQTHDHVLTAAEREQGAFSNVAAYIFENPVRASLCKNWQSWPYAHCAVPGYPELDPRMSDYWLRFWRCYNYLVEKRSS